MSRALILIYGIIAYTIGLVGLSWFIVFMGGFEFLPKHINSGVPGPLGQALFINIGLIVVFGVQHSVMARQGFKQQLTQFVPKAAERSTYVLFSGLVMAAICLYWQPLEGILWQVDNPIAALVLTAGYFIGWGIALLATFVINHFELMGLQQVYLNFKNKPEPTASFTERFFYKFVRHPLQLGILIGIWSTASMTATQAFLATTMTVYIFIGLYYEEQDLVASLGDSYKDYQKRVNKLLPIPKR